MRIPVEQLEINRLTSAFQFCNASHSALATKSEFFHGLSVVNSNITRVGFNLERPLTSPFTFSSELLGSLKNMSVISGSAVKILSVMAPKLASRRIRRTKCLS